MFKSKPYSAPSPLTMLPRHQLEAMAHKLEQPFSDLLKEEQIEAPRQAVELLSGLYLPIADWLIKRGATSPHFIGINGAQGSGKSTLCKILDLLLSEGFGKRVATLSIDDLYFTRTERKRLADTVHSLLITRGVPGTHDIDLGLQLFQQLREQHGSIKLPLFDKSLDDRTDESRWPNIDLPVDIVLFEGWCVGTKPQAETELASPINALEHNEDNDGQWRHYVNQQLTQHYPALFNQLHTLVMLEIPDFGKVMEWRSLQEQKLHRQKSDQPHLMDETAIKRFIMHYERLTRANLAEMPQRADLLLKLNDQHQICEIGTRKAS